MLVIATAYGSLTTMDRLLSAYMPGTVLSVSFFIYRVFNLIPMLKVGIILLGLLGIKGEGMVGPRN